MKRFILATTLVELLIAIAIFSIVTLGILGILNIADKFWNMNTGLVELQQKVRPVIEEMVREIRQGLNVTIKNNNKEIEFNIPNNQNKIAYYLDNNRIYRQEGHNNRVLASNIGNLFFNYNSSLKVVEIQINATKTVKQAQLLFNLTQKVKLRN